LGQNKTPFVGFFLAALNNDFWLVLYVHRLWKILI